MNKIPCEICGPLILPVTVRINNGLCAQCARDPQRLQREEERRRRIAELGPQTSENARRKLIDLTEEAALEGKQRFACEGIWGFVFFADPSLEGVMARIITNAWAAKFPPKAMLGYIYDETYMVKEDEFGFLSMELFYNLEDIPSREHLGNTLLPFYLEALRNVRDKNILDEKTVFLLVSGGMGDEEILVLAEHVNNQEALQKLERELTLDETDLEKMGEVYRRDYPKLADRDRTDPHGPAPPHHHSYGSVSGGSADSRQVNPKE